MALRASHVLIAAQLILPAAALAQCGLSYGPPISSSGAATLQMLLADFNGDARLDTCMLSNAGFTIGLGSGTGTFSPLAPVPVAAATCAAIGDFNGDSRIDIAVAQSSIVRMFLGVGDGTFTIGPSINTTAPGATTMAAADLNHDGFIDLLVNTSVNHSLAYYRNLGGGSFAAPINTAGVNGGVFVLADFSGDNELDAVFLNTSSNTLERFIGSGFGPFAFTGSITTGLAPSSLAAADFNGDGRLDLACTPNGSQIVTFTNTGSFSFGPGQTISVPGGPQRLVAADLNADGRPDLGAICSNSTFVYGLNNAGTILPLNSVSIGSAPVTLAAANFAGDSGLDLAIGFFSGSTIQSLTATVTTAPAITAQPAGVDALAGTPAAFTVAATGGNLSFEWRRNNIPLTNGGAISGANSPTLTINPVTAADHLSTYKVVITNACGTITSEAAPLAVHNCPADFNGDSTVDFFDYLDFVDAFSIGC